MPKVTLTQFSFNRGELDPALHGRADWRGYAAGAQRIVNLIPRAAGGVTKRGGLRLVTPALDAGAASRLIPFRFSVKQSYMLEFADHRMRVIKDGGVVVYPAGHGRAGEEVVLATPYPATALPALRHCQTADVMILTHPDHPPRRLTRRAHHDWEFSFLLANHDGARPEGLAVTAAGRTARYAVTAVIDGNETPPSEAVGCLAPGGVAPPEGGAFTDLYNWLKENGPDAIPAGLAFHNMTAAELISFLTACGYADLGTVTDKEGYHWRHRAPGAATEAIISYWPLDRWYLEQECLAAADGGLAGTARDELLAAAEAYAATHNEALPDGGATVLAWSAVAGAERYRVYRCGTSEDDEAFRPIGETPGTDFTDAALPALPGALPAAADMFSSIDDYPGVCAFFEERLVLARTNNAPCTFWGTETGTYNSFAKHTPLLDTDAYEFTLASGEMNAINWIVPLNDMLLGTSGGEWKAGGQGRAVTPSNINCRLQSWFGSGSPRPVVAGRTILFAGRAGRTLRNLSYSLEADGYAGRDLTAYAAHLFRGRSIRDMCLQQEPSSVIWVVMTDGSLLSCTYAPEEDVAAWARHSTAGKFESCAALVDVDGTDGVYFCVARTVAGEQRRFIEVLATAADESPPGDASSGLFLDCALTYRGPATGTVEGLGHLEGERISVLADGGVFTDLLVQGASVTLPAGCAARVIHAGLPYAAELTTLEMEPEAGDSPRGRARFAVSAAVRLYATRECRYGVPGGVTNEMKFRRDEPPGHATRPFTGEKNILFTSPAGCRTARLCFASPSPAPFTLLGLTMEAACGSPA